MSFPSKKVPRRTALLSAGVAASGVVTSGVIFFGDIGSRHIDKSGQRQGIDIRLNPVAIVPHGDYSASVSESEVRELLMTMIPTWPNLPKLDFLVHAFRLWGQDASFHELNIPSPFQDKPVFTGPEMESIFLSAQRFTQLFSGDSPLVTRSNYGFRCRVSASELPGSTGAFLVHQDTLLRTLAHLGYSSTYPVTAIDLDRNSYVRGTIGDLIAHSMRSFVFSQELEWSAEALARYLAPEKGWTNGNGEYCTFDEMAMKLLAQKPGTGSCMGLHVPFALVCLIRISQVTGILSAKTLTLVEQRLRDISSKLDASQLDDGTFTGLAVARQSADLFEDRSSWISRSQLTYISHSLEWISLAPASCRPSTTTLIRAANALIRGLSPWSMYARAGEYGPISHAGVALSMLLGKSAYQIVQGAD